MTKDDGISVGVLIAYAERDLAAARDLKQRLAAAGCRIWLPDDELSPGKNIRYTLEEAMAQAAVAVVCLSREALRRSGRHYRLIRWALDRQKETPPGGVFTIPVKLEPCDTPSLFGNIVAAELYRGDNELVKLQRAFKSLSEEQKTAIGLNASAIRAQSIQDQLTQEKERKKTETLADRDTTATDARILTLKRELRDGPPPKEGLRLGPDGRFELWERVGSGGFATVWKAYDHREEKPVAVKVLHGQHVANQSRKDRFRRGARKMKALQHPSIVGVVEPWCEDEGYCFYAMEWMPGGDMQRAVQEGDLPPEQVIPMILAVGEALQFAHKEQVVHRDVKPSNILLDGKGGAKLTDFDLVQAHDTTGGTRTGALGTVIYAAPEALENAKNVNPAVDVYGLAMSCIFGLHGRPLTLAVYKHAETVIEKLPCTPPVKDVLAQGVEWDLGKRFPSARMFVEKLAAAQQLPKGVVQKRSPKTSVEASEVSDLGWSKYAMPAAEAVEDKDALAMVRVFEAQGHGWPLQKRMEWLEKLGSLGDPRLDPLRRDRWAAIEPGEFVMGNNRGGNSEKPEHRIEITRKYWLGRYPVTNQEYAKFIEAGGYESDAYWSEEGRKWLEKNKEKEPWFWRDPQWNRPNQPVVGVSWHEAEAYCRWLEEALRARRSEWAPNKLKVELPSEAQWEYAARGPKSKIYPWTGETEPKEDLTNYVNSGIGRTTPVGMYPRGATPEGLLDMAGNVWEWQRDEWQDDYKKCQDGDKDPVGKGDPSPRPLRGGSWGSHAGRLRASCRSEWFPWSREGFVGFRCCLRSSSPEHG